MVLLIDTNVLINVLARREGFEESKKILEYCAQEENQGYMAFHSLSILWYVLRRKPENERREMMLDLCDTLDIAGAGKAEVIEALKHKDFHDFEDCLQDKCASTVMADYIITDNVKDYVCAYTKAVTPKEFLQMLG